MAQIQRQAVLRLLSRRPTTTAALLRPTETAQVPRISLAASTSRHYHQSCSLQDKSTPSPPRPQQSNSRESFFVRRRQRREARNRISTLALEHPDNIFGTEEQDTRQEKYRGGEGRGEHHNQSNASTRLISLRSRRLLLLCGILLVPVIGRDVMEFVVPGLLGTVIFVGGKVKAGIKWVRSFGSDSRA